METELDQLRRGNQALTEQLVAITGRLESYKTAIEQSNDRRYDALQREIDTMRFLTRYNRRTHFMVMGYITFTVASLYSLLTRYDGIGWALIFPLVSHPGGPEWLEAVLRALGLVAQLAWIGWLYRHSQVPKWLEHRVTKLALTEESYREKWPDDEPASSSGPDRAGP